MKKYILIAVISFSFFLAKAQNPPMLLSFELNRYKNEIIVTWEIAAGNLCSGLQVEHSADSVNFTSIYNYPGICGNSTSNERYTFAHTNPIENATNYYRINLNVNGISETLAITYIKLKENGYALFPMPIESTSKLFFNNDNKESAVFEIYNSAGSKVIQQQDIKTNEIDLSNFMLPAGIYHFSIRMADIKNVEGKFVVGK